jgi:RNA polymerase sigma-70 factor, ECF subfamily
MSETSRSELLNALVTGYDDLKRRLTARLGSAELAGDALQDVFLRLGSSSIGDVVKSPRAYLLRAAFNIAMNRVIAEKRLSAASDIDAFFDIPDDRPDQGRIVEANSEIAALKRAIRELPRRRQEIIVAVALNDVPIITLAARYGVTVRTIQIELKYAILHCADRLDRRPPTQATRRPQMTDPVLPKPLNRPGHASRNLSATREKY